MTGAFDLRVMGLLLRQARRLNVLSLGLLALSGLWLVATALGIGALGVAGGAGLIVSVVAGLGQAYYAMRVDFDAALLLSLAECNDAVEAAATLDASLQTLGLLPPTHAGRDWPARWRGARGLLRRQGACLVAQMLAFALCLGLAQ